MRYLVTNSASDPKQLYETAYCAQGKMGNRI